MDPNNSRVLVIGVDQAILGLIKEFATTGLIPHINNLIERGVIAEAFPCPPCDTPTNWATIATGVTTAIHGATSFYLHLPGEPFDVALEHRSRTQLAQHAGAPYLWDVADAHGVPSFVINYPAGWPAKLKHGAMSLWKWKVPGALPRIVITPKTLEFGSAGTHSLPLQRYEKPIEGLTGVPPFPSVVLQFHPQAPPFTGVLQASQPNQYDALALLDVNGTLLQVITPSSWSDWIAFPVDQQGPSLACLCKIMPENIDPAGNSLKLNVSTIYNTRGWTSPESLGEKLVRNLATEETTTSGDTAVEYMFDGDVEPFLKSAKEVAVAVGRAMRFAQEEYHWRLGMFHVHHLDSVNHRALASIHPGTPGYSQETHEQGRISVETGYKIVDDLVGYLLELCVDPNTTVIFVADHGAIPVWKNVNLPLAFMEAGLISYTFQRKRFRVDWEKTLAYPYMEPPYVWVNLEGRDPDGIVPPAEYETVRDRIIETLYALRDPQTGQPVVKLALRREDAAFMGQNGNRVGDVVYFFHAPYQSFDGRLEDLNAAVVPPDLMARPLCSDARMCFGAHAYYLPTERVAQFSVSSPLIITGPGIRQGVELESPVNLVDVHPTVTHILGIPQSPKAQGRVLYEIFE